MRHLGRHVAVRVVGEIEIGVLVDQAVDRLDEGREPGLAPELAVGHGIEPGRLLHGDDVAYRLVLDRGEAGVVERAGFVRLVGVLDHARAQQAADVIGAADGTGHGTLLPRMR